jgi:hypothetical protein
MHVSAGSLYNLCVLPQAADDQHALHLLCDMCRTFQAEEVGRRRLACCNC